MDAANPFNFRPLSVSVGFDRSYCSVYRRCVACGIACRKLQVASGLGVSFISHTISDLVSDDSANGSSADVAAAFRCSLLAMLRGASKEF